MVNATFSPKNVHRLANLVEQKVSKLIDRFERDSVDGAPVNIHKSMKVLSMDIISELTVGRSFGCLDHPSFRNVFSGTATHHFSGDDLDTEVLVHNRKGIAFHSAVDV